MRLRCPGSLLWFLAATVAGGATAYEAFPAPGNRLCLSANGVDFLCAAVPGGTVRQGTREHAVGLPHPARDVALAGFWIGVQEVTVGQYGAYLRSLPPGQQGTHPQFTGRGTALRPRAGLSGYPVSHLTAAEAEAFCRWLSNTSSRTVRLPDEEEWEAAARGGIHGARYPWGWNPPAGRAAFRAGKPGPPCRFEPNPYGLYDMAGSLWEWCRPQGDIRIARGGAWPERAASMLRVSTRMPFEKSYRNADTGFRILVER